MDSGLGIVIASLSAIIGLWIFISFILWAKETASNSKKTKKLLFALLYLKIQEMKAKGIDVDIKEVYEKGESL
jgi:hypothetical protein